MIHHKSHARQTTGLEAMQRLYPCTQIQNSSIHSNRMLASLYRLCCTSRSFSSSLSSSVALSDPEESSVDSASAWGDASSRLSSLSSSLSDSFRKSSRFWNLAFACTGGRRCWFPAETGEPPPDWAKVGLATASGVCAADAARESMKGRTGFSS